MVVHQCSQEVSMSIVTRRWASLRAPVAVMALVVMACGEEARDVIAPPQASVTDEVEAVTRAIALGMAEPAARHAVRDAMRASPLTEHKLSLREYAASNDGDALIRAAARATGTTTSGLRARIAVLPDLDFYLPG